MDITIRTAIPDDAEQLLAIYAPYVEQTAITFEYDVPSVEEFRHRIEKSLEKFPYLVAEHNGQIVGYTYASTFRVRPAYNHCVEMSIYIAQDAHRRAIGTRLYEELESRLRDSGFINLNASVTWVEKENNHLTHQSISFHEKMGYKKVAHFHRCGYKFGEWYDMVWMEKLLDVKYFKPRCSAPAGG